MCKYEVEFIKVFGQKTFEKVQKYIVENDLVTAYMKAREDPQDLFKFAFHYGIIQIVSFCYCILKISVDIHEAIGGYHISIQSGDNSSTQVLAESGGFNKGISISTMDKYTNKRNECIVYMEKVRRYSVYTKKDKKFLYQVKDKYIEDYQLLCF